MDREVREGGQRRGGLTSWQKVCDEVMVGHVAGVQVQPLQIIGGEGSLQLSVAQTWDRGGRGDWTHAVNYHITTWTRLPHCNLRYM